MPALGYLNTTEPAVRHMFLGLDAYTKATPPPSLAKYMDEDGVIWMSREDAKRYMGDYIDSLALEFAKATLCGSIVQVAYTGISQYSVNTAIPGSCKRLGVKKKSRSAKFCIGREIHGIPMGLFIYAARIQYNHWEEGEPSNSIARNVFRHLYSAHSSDPLFDMAYDLEYPVPRPVTHYVVQVEFRWKKYEDYLEDIKVLLGV